MSSRIAILSSRLPNPSTCAGLARDQEKLGPRSLLGLTAADLRARFRTACASAGTIVCDAISPCSQSAREACERSHAQFSRTTLVLEFYAADFSTDADNSALIVIDEISRAATATGANEKKNNNKRDFPTIRFGSPGRNAMSRKKLSRRQFVAATALSFGGADHRALSSGPRDAAGKPHDGPLGSLGSRRQQGLHRPRQ